MVSSFCTNHEFPNCPTHASISATKMQATAAHAMIGLLSAAGMAAIPIGAMPTAAVFIIGCCIGIVWAIG